MSIFSISHDGKDIYVQLPDENDLKMLHKTSYRKTFELGIEHLCFQWNYTSLSKNIQKVYLVDVFAKHSEDIRIIYDKDKAPPECEKISLKYYNDELVNKLNQFTNITEITFESSFKKSYTYKFVITNASGTKAICFHATG